MGDIVPRGAIATRPGHATEHGRPPTGGASAPHSHTGEADERARLIYAGLRARQEKMSDFRPWRDGISGFVVGAFRARKGRSPEPELDSL